MNLLPWLDAPEYGACRLAKEPFHGRWESAQGRLRESAGLWEQVTSPGTGNDDTRGETMGRHECRVHITGGSP